MLADVILYILSPDEDYGADTGSARGPDPKRRHQHAALFQSQPGRH